MFPLRFRFRRKGGAPATDGPSRASLVRKMLAAQAREREHVLAGLVNVRGLMPLLMKSRNGGRWTADERVALRGHLRALANLSPYLLVMLLPGSFLALPVLAWWLDRRRRQRGALVRA